MTRSPRVAPALGREAHFIKNSIFAIFLAGFSNIFNTFFLTYLTSSLADTLETYCHRHTTKEWPITRTHTYEDTHTHKKEKKKKKERKN